MSMADVTMQQEAAHAANVQEFVGLQTELARLNDQVATLLGRVDAFAAKLVADPLATVAHADEVAMLRKSVDDTRLAVEDALKVQAVALPVKGAGATPQAKAAL
jgi:hypothetical protein